MNKWISTNISTYNQGNDRNFLITFSPGNISQIPFLEAATDAAHKISAIYGKELILCFSGGSDSEFILRLFHSCGLPIIPAIIVSEVNSTESGYALSVCQELHIEPKIINLTLEEFILEHVKQLRTYGLRALLGTTPMVIHKSIGGAILTGFGDPTPSAGTASVVYVPEWDFYTDVLGPGHPGPFFTFTPELFLSYITDISKTVDIQEAKCGLYNLPYREKVRYNSIVYDIQGRINTLQNKSHVHTSNEKMRQLLLSGSTFSL
jgi:hypothetical protein